MAVEIPNEYKETIRKCPLTIKPGTGSEPKEKVEVDWSIVLMGEPGHAGQSFLLGWEPRAVPKGKWLDESLQYAPAPAWAQSDTYIKALETENAKLKAELAKK